MASGVEEDLEIYSWLEVGLNRAESRLDRHRSINACAESFNGLYKTELIHRQGPWRNVEHVEWATLNYVDWFNNQRIHESLGYLPPVEFEAQYHHTNESESLTVLEMI